MKLDFENILLLLIALGFLGFMVGLVGRNTGNSKKKTLRGESFYKYLTSISVIVLLLAAFLYSILFS
jgi:hypothetical protein